MTGAGPGVGVVCETARLRLRRMVDRDAGFYRELLNDPDFIANIGARDAGTDEKALALMQDRVLSSYSEHGFGMYLVEQRSDGRAVGIAGLVKRDFLPEVDLGYALLPVGRGKGYAREAARAVIEHALRDLGIKRLSAITSPDNAASIRVLEDLRFQAAGTITFPDDGETCSYFELELPGD